MTVSVQRTSLRPTACRSYQMNMPADSCFHSSCVRPMSNSGPSKNAKRTQNGQMRGFYLWRSQHSSVQLSHSFNDAWLRSESNNESRKCKMEERAYYSVDYTIVRQRTIKTHISLSCVFVGVWYLCSGWFCVNGKLNVTATTPFFVRKKYRFSSSQLSS